MVESSNILLFFVVIAIGVGIFYYKHFHYKTKIKRQSKNSEPIDILPTDINNEEEFMTMIAENHKSYEEFIRSSDFDNYFEYWKSHPKSVEKIKELIENKKNKSFFKYKNIKY